MLLLKICRVLCSWWWEKKKYINKAGWQRKKKLRNEKGMWCSRGDLGEKDCLWRDGSLPVHIKWMLMFDDCHCLPEHLMAGQCHSLYASRAHLSSFISVSHCYKTEQLIKGQIDFAPFWTRGMNSGSIFITSFLIDTVTLACNFFLLPNWWCFPMLYRKHAHVSDVFDQAYMHPQTGALYCVVCIRLWSRPPAIWRQHFINMYI